MPLKPGGSKATISKNIKEMVKQTMWSAHLAACVVIRNQYNSGLAKKNRLPLPSGIIGADDE
jgi:hypothetical protein